ncbi:MAG: DUF72 domain-containing protein [Gammaproteobacteria bacterium]|nr:DUF72 domain-containing protein [Gammaproteobacteria bacterium]
MIHDSDEQTEQSTGSLNNLQVGAYGWRHERWLNNFYPDDLPPDWQLGFYANEFSAVLIPAHYWLDDDCDAEQWLNEVYEQFRFYVECPDDATAEKIKQQAALLGDQMAGFLNRKTFNAVDGIDQDSAIALINPQAKNTREWKNWLQAFAQHHPAGNLQAVFLSDEIHGVDQLSVEQVKEFKTLVELMGL